MDSHAGRRSRAAPLLLRSGRLCLDFIGTAPFEPARRPDQVAGAARWAEWLGKARLSAPRHVSDDDLDEMRMLRYGLGRLIESMASDERAAREVVTTVNRFAAVDPPPPVLALDGTALIRPAEQTNGQALAVIARDALDLVTGPHAQRIRVCANPQCGFFFADASHAGSRRWCVSCGAAAASARYRRSRSEVAQTS